jgi:hypothetical protein
VVCDRNIITTLNTLTKQIKEYDYMIEVHVLKASLKFELLLLEFLLNSSTLISKRKQAGELDATLVSKKKQAGKLDAR